MRTTVEHVHHRHGQHVGIRSTNRRVQRSGGCPRVCMGQRQTRTKQRIRAEPCLVCRAIQRDHCGVGTGLIGGVTTHEHTTEFAIDVCNGFGDALAGVSLATIAKLHRFVLAGGCAGRHYRGADGPIFEVNIDFNGGVAARVEYFAANDIGDLHGAIRLVELALGFVPQCIELRQVACSKIHSALRGEFLHASEARDELVGCTT